MTKHSGDTTFDVDLAQGKLVVHGDLDFYAEPEFQKACAELAESPAAGLVLDIRESRFICSSSLGVLFLLYDRTKTTGKTVKVLAGRAIAPICELMGLDKFIEFEIVE